MKFSEHGRGECLKRFLPVIIFTAIIYLTIPAARPISNFFIKHNLFQIIVYVSLSIFIIADIFLILRYAGFSIINVVYVSVFFTAYFSIVQIYKVPAEKIHFIEYGLLAFLLFRALKLNVPDKLNYPLSFLIIIMIGWGDEAIQLVVPDRYYDLSDVFLNGLSGGLILLLIFIVEKLKGRKAGPIFK